MEMPKGKRAEVTFADNVVTENRKRFHKVVSPSVPAVILDAEGTVQHITPAARNLLDLKGSRNLEGCFFAHVHGKNQLQVMRDVADMVCYGKTGAHWLLRLRTGHDRWEWFKATVRNYLDQPESAIVITLRDGIEL